MRTVTSNTAMTYSRMMQSKDRIRSMLHNRPNFETGGTLNDQGDAAFRTRVNALLKENGIDENVGFGRVKGSISLGMGEDGKHVVVGDHPDKQKIEDLINNDEQLKQIKADPANAYFQKGAAQTAEAAGAEGDSAFFSEEARLMYELRAKEGEQAYTSPQEETAEVMEWMDRRDFKKRLREHLANGGEIKVMTNTLTTFEEDEMSANPNFDFSDTGILQSGDMKEFLNARSWMETEVKALLEKAGIDTSKLSNIKMAVYDGGKLEISKETQEGLTEEDRLKIQTVLNAPGNEELRNVIGRVLGDEQIISGTLQRATGLSLTDWAQVAKESGGDLASVNNEGMQKLLENDPELAAALNQLIGGTGIVGNTYLPPSAHEEAEHAVSAFGYAVSTVVNGAAESTGMTPQEIEELKKNLVVEGDSSGNLKISGTKNQRFLNAVQELFNHYTSGIFGDFLRRGSFLNQALGLGNAGDGVNFSMTFPKGVAEATFAYGDGEKHSVKA